MRCTDIFRFPILVILASGCGSLTPALKNGSASYANSLINQQLQQSKGKSEPFTTMASGCFANSEQAIENEIIIPAIQKKMAEHKAIKAENVLASRQTSPTVADALTGAFIWSCSYWDIKGDLVY